MELSFSLNYLEKVRGSKMRRDFSEMVALCRDAGFRYVDYTPDFQAPDFAEKAYRDREILDAAGIAVEQTHAPMNRYRTYPDERFGEYYKNAFEASKIVGAKYVVVHGDEYRVTDRYDEREIQDFAYDFLAPYVDYAKKNGMAVAIENLFEDHCFPEVNGRSRFTSTAGELKGLIERFNDPSVGCCWDFGHAACAFGTDKMLSALMEMGSCICCTHVHDNYYGKDLHVSPFLGDIDWESHMKHLKTIGYKGKFSFELVYGSYPDALIGKWLKHIYEVGEYLVSL